MVRSTLIDEPRYPVQAAAARTGLGAGVLRAWERRYGAVEPVRSPVGERLYSDRQIHRLNLLRLLTQNGHRISRIAVLPEAELERLLLGAGISPVEAHPSLESADLEPVLAGRGRAAVEALDAAMLEEELARARTILTPLGLMDGVLVPLLHRAEAVPARGPVVRAARAGLVEILTESARELARILAPIGSGRAMLVSSLGLPHGAMFSMAAATTSVQGLRATILHEENDSSQIEDFVRHEHPVGAVAAVPRSIAPEEALARIEALQLLLDDCRVTSLLCVCGQPATVELLDDVEGIEVCSTFRELAALIDASRH